MLVRADKDGRREETTATGKERGAGDERRDEGEERHQAALLTLHINVLILSSLVPLIMSDQQQEISMSKDASMSELEWTNLLEEIDTSFETESPMQKARRKFTKEPLIPVGMFDSCPFALT